MTEVRTVAVIAPVSWVAASRTLPLSAVIAPFSKIFCRMPCARPRLKSAPTSIKPWNSAKSTPPKPTPLSRASNTPARLTKAARQADLVIEAVPEEMESKIEIFTMLDKICRPTTILARIRPRSASPKSPASTYRAKKCVGMHFFNPVHKMKLLEIVRALETDADTLAAVVEVGKRMRKEVVVIKESSRLHHQPHQRHDRNEAF